MLKPQPKDISDMPIYGGLSGIPYVQTINTVSGTWSPVVLQYEESKQVILQPRQITDWYFATTSGGSYFTLRAGAALHAPVVVTSGTTIGWIACNQTMVFELLVGR